ncbi:hypothetical protein HAX54_041637, partial [Datura stramonium]|nr:hypothetical protein [Datura stramonium]
SWCGGKYNARTVIKENRKEVIDKEDQCVKNKELQDNRKNSSNDTINTEGTSVKENETTVGTISINDPNELQ